MANTTARAGVVEVAAADVVSLSALATAKPHDGAVVVASRGYRYGAGQLGPTVVDSPVRQVDRVK
jgi:hypothetical protein